MNQLPERSKIAVTGGAGYIGARLCEQLLNATYEVHCIDWLAWGIEPVLNIIDHERFHLHKMDICDPAVEPILASCDAVIHLAGIIGFPACNAQPDLAYRVNVEGTKRVVDASVGKMFVYASTGSVYGALDTVCTETVSTNPISTYSVYKLAGEEYLAGTDAVILRPATAFGVSNRLRNDLLINDFVRQACQGKAMTLFEGHFKRTFLSTNDLTRAFLWGITHNDVMRGEIWNVGDARLNHTKLEICEIIKQHIPAWNYTEDTSLKHDQDGRNYFVDYTKIKNIGFSAEETLDQGIRNLITVYNNL
jgi:nucleoside-diphosphate-sugar epimerase